ncbi:hypothetical protein [Phormidium sp. FACHB-1136]|uniref:Eco57I restriction-modification methylase domain-containing protein n=1 Tax=Phormidium sp. FACHB-1136 TaxID=2692848 RepID=UPI0016850889|nr:hypothetical protein [Phormidium sp. FACHB-1136]MBD2426224.1 hypothetical protein [Phormidium sp. FACHB-1136]
MHISLHFGQKVWTKEIKRMRNEVVKEELRELLAGGVQLSMFENRLLQPPEQTHDELQAAVEAIHMAVLDPEEQAATYETAIRQKQTLQQLKWAFDCWCAVWFWQGNDIDLSPTPMQFVDPSPEVRAAVERVAQEYQFFHWELEFPDVFCAPSSPQPPSPTRGEGGVNLPSPSQGEGLGVRVNHSGVRVPGFDAIVGNPPWEIQKPNSKEFFSNIDPLYRTYGKQEALEYQRRYFEADPAIEESWLAYCARLKALSNWCKYVASAFGDDEAMGSKFSLSRRKAEAEQLATEWRKQRAKRTGYSDPEHPYRYQGSADINTYKMFLELGHALLREGGELGLIVPSGIYTDKGSTSLRRLFLNRCNWRWLYVFENRDGIFPAVDGRFKFCPVVVQKGGQTNAIKTRFMERDLNTWAQAEPDYLPYPREQVAQFSPYTYAILEIRSNRDLKILEKMYANGVLLGDDGPNGWGIQYAREFDMTNDSKLFPPRPKWEAQGYKADEYGHWLKGEWRESGVGSRESGRGEVPSPSEKRESGVILSADGREMIRVDEVEDVALPLYQGVMIQQFDFSRKGWVSGTGLRAIWRDIPFESKCLEPQFLIELENYSENSKNSRGLRVSFRDIARSTDERTFISSLIPDLPCGNKVPILSSISSTHGNLELCSLANSFSFDFALRSRLGGTSLNYFIVAELPLARKIEQSLRLITAQVNFITPKFALDWLRLKQFAKPDMRWQQLWAITPYERLRLRCILDAVVAELYGLDYEDFAWILQDCDHPVAQVCNNTFARSLEPKGFWRVDKEKDPEMRHTVLSLVAFHHLKHLGLDAFLNLNHGEGWMLPETLRLADYGLGHDHRAQTPQPVAARIGADTAKLWHSGIGNRESGIGAEQHPDSRLTTPDSRLPTHAQYRFLPWQLQGTPEDSWAECEMHAENLRQLLGKPESSVVNRESSIGKAPDPDSPLPTPDSRFPSTQQLNLIPPNEEQLHLF